MPSDIEGFEWEHQTEEDVDIGYDEDEDEDEDMVDEDDNSQLQDIEIEYNTQASEQQQTLDDGEVGEALLEDEDGSLVRLLLSGQSGVTVGGGAVAGLFQLIQSLEARGSFFTRHSTRRTTQGPRTHATKQLFNEVTEPQAAGVELLMSGEFGKVSRKDQRPRGRKSPRNLACAVKNRQRSWRSYTQEDIASDVLPNSNGTVVARYRACAYSGQYSADSSFYYTCCRDFRLHVYDTTAPLRHGSPMKYDGHDTTMKLIKTVNASPDSWTITDSHLSPDNERMIWASVTPIVCMTSSTGADVSQTPISFQDPNGRSDHASHMRGFGYHEGCSIWSCRFSADGNEIVAGGAGRIFVYDLLGDRRTVKIEAHEDDVNSCCWADTASGNILISASDDSFLKVWDRRSLGSNPKPSGVLIGHTEGITYVAPKGDGRYVISNGKDQMLRLWDLRKMRSNLQFEEVKDKSYGVQHFDYRHDYYRRPNHAAHPLDCSVMKYHGHAVLRTLIRCHFSPIETTGQQYIYSGSADGRIHIWSLDGRVVQVLDRSKTLPVSFDPSEPDPAEDLPSSKDKVCVRDVTWHTQEPVLMSAGWDGYGVRMGSGSTIARHEWKGLMKKGGRLRHNGLEDYLEAELSEQREQRLPGGFQDDSDDEDDEEYIPPN